LHGPSKDEYFKYSMLQTGPNVLLLYLASDLIIKQGTTFSDMTFIHRVAWEKYMDCSEEHIASVFSVEE
jgi:hypothetical protein